MEQIKTSYKNYFGNKDFLMSLLVSFVILAVALIINFYAGTYATKIASNSVTDIILSNIRVYDLDGIFVNARPAATLPEGKTCHQLWGNSFDEFLKKLSDTMAINQEKFDRNFLQQELSNVWLGRINNDSKRDCATVSSKYSVTDPSKVYSFTATCQNWTIGQETVSGYPPAYGQTPNFPKCYNTLGQRVNAVSLVGLSTEILGPSNGIQYFSPASGKYCNTSQKLICVQQ